MIAVLALLGQEPIGEELLSPAVQTPSVDWAAVAPIVALALGGVLLLTITSVSRGIPLRIIVPVEYLVTGTMVYGKALFTANPIFPSFLVLKKGANTPASGNFYR